MSTNGSTARAVCLRAVGAALPATPQAVADIAAAWDQRGGKATLAVCGPDEDTLTLAWGAAEAALAAAGLGPEDVDGLWWGTARPPMAEGPSHAFLSAALGLGPVSGGLLASGSTHAGLDALGAAADALLAGTADRALVVASDALVPGPRTSTEKETGAGAVAFVCERVGSGDGEATARLVTRVTRTAPLLDRYRGDAQPATGEPYDPRLYRERELVPSVRSTVESLRAACGGDLPAGTRWAVPDPDGRLGAVVARTARIPADDMVSAGVQGRIGDCGSAAAFFGALRALSTPGPLAIVGTGGGRTTALVFEVEAPVVGATEALEALDGGARGTRPVAYTSVLRTRGQLVPLAEPVAMGVPPGSAAFVRGNVETLTLLGRRCPVCATVAVPPSIHPVCPNCGHPGGELIPLARHGTVHTFVVNHTMPPPFEAPLPMAVIDLVDGSRVLLQGMPEDAADLAIGDPVELELRRYATERGVPVYGYKARRAAARVPAGAVPASA